MASANVVSLADRVLKSLRDLAMDKTRLSTGVRTELVELEEIMSETRAVLDNAEKRAQKYDMQVAYWIERLGDVLHEADNVVDELHTEILRNSIRMREERVLMKVCISYPITFNLFFLRKLTKIKRRAYEIAEERTRFNLVFGLYKPNDPASLLTRARRRQPLEVAEDNLIGRDSELHHIVAMLVGPYSEDQNVSIISVVGEAGIGKTALARVAFTHERCIRHFVEIWVDVSGAFDGTRIADSILKYVTGRSTPSKDAEIEQMLEEELAGRKYLLVLDDVRSIDPDRWLDFKRLLMSGAEGSRVLLTTRSVEAARIASTMPVFLSRLDIEESWWLFKRVAFMGQEPPSERIEEIAQEILFMCRGVPFIIRTVGFMMQEIGTTDVYEWLAKGREYLDVLFMEEGDVILHALKLRFNRLPSHLKDCFAYCSLFPRGHEIDVQTLIKLWVAQQFVTMSHTERSLEDLGYEKFMFLLNRDFFETIERDIWGRATKCKMSDAMHELAAKVAGEECIKLDEDHQDAPGVPLHVSFDFPLSSRTQISTSFRAARVRSILIPCQSSIKQGSSSRAICDAIISNMKFLRTLDLHDSGIETVPDHIDELKHLRYLDLSRNVKIKVLSNSVTKLLNLQTLKLSLCFRLKELPRDIKNLVNLRHLEIDGCYNLTHMPRGLGLLTQLQTLSLFVLSKDAKSTSHLDVGQLVELSTLDNLRGELQIKNLRHDTDVGSARLEEKRNLQSLALDWEIGTTESDGHEALVTRLMSHVHLGGLTLSGYRGNTLPIEPSLDNKLTKLVMRKCPDCRCLPPLHLFPSLEVLVLEDMANLECVSEYVEDRNSSHSRIIFPSLYELRLTGLPLLRSWWKGVECNENHIFCRLSILFIEDCPKLVSMPLFPTLEEGLVLDSCNLKPFQDTLKVKTEDLRFRTSTPADEASSSTSISALPSSFSPPLSKLKNLSIVGIEEFDNKEADGITWESLRSLQYLRLDYLPSLESLPVRMRHFTRLRELHIWRCSFTVLPEWIVDLKKLKKLSIWICPDLKSLPEKIGSLTSLRTLEIEDCPMLVHRCQRKAGAYWDRISRIPDLRIDLSSRR